MAALTKKVSAQEVKKNDDVKKTAIHYPFWFGGSASCFATFFTHPLDLGKFYQLLALHNGLYGVVKVRLQTQTNGASRLNMVQMFGHVAKHDGFSGLYKGVSIFCSH